MTGPVVTVTPNPSIDWTLAVGQVVRGRVHRADGSRREPSGKGVNVSRALRANDVATVAVLPCGGAAGRELRELLEATGVPHRCVPIRGEVRVNVSLTEPDGTATKVNSPGPTLSAGEVEALVGAAAVAAQGAAALLLSGSLPPAVPEDLYARIGRLVHNTGAVLALDSSATPLLAGLAGRPHLVKPNAHELAEVTGTRLHTVGDVLAAAATLRDRGAGRVVVSLGVDGAVLVDGEEPLHAHAFVADPVSTVGAGDALVAGLLAGTVRGLDRRDVLREGVAWSSAAVTAPGSDVPPVTDAHRGAVTVVAADPDRRLAEPA